MISEHPLFLFTYFLVTRYISWSCCSW